MRRADLRGATFRRSYLLEATFDAVDLRGTAFEEVDCDQASFAGSVFEEDEIASSFRGALGSLLEEEVVLSGATGRRRATTTELIDRARALPSRLSLTERVAPGGVVPVWRWSAK